MKEKLQKLPSLLSGAFICAVLMLAVYALKGVWPFGTGDITYDDMAQGTLPIYYHLYDWMHGLKTAHFDWFTGLGTNIVNSGTFTPLDLVLCLFPRSKLLYGIGILVIVKVMASAVTAKFVFDKLFTKANEIWRILFSVLYAMSAYSMFYYTNSFWLDFVVLFPLVIYGLKLLLVNGKPIAYTLFFAYTLYLSVYIGFMVTLSIFFLSALYILLMCEKPLRGQRTCLLGLSTFAGALLSAWHSVPMAIQTLASQRLETSFDDATEKNPLLEILKVQQINSMPSKLMLLIGLQLAIVLTIVLVFKLAKEKKYKESLFALGCYFVMFAPVIFENTNLFWHGGSYIQFTMRFFFCSVFVILCLALYCINNYGETVFTPKKKFTKAVIIAITILLIVGFVAGIVFFAEKALGKFGEEDTYSYVKAVAFAILFVTGLPLFTLLLCQKKHISRAFCFMLCIAQTLGTCYAGIANTHQQDEEVLFYNSASYLEYCEEVAQMDLDCGELGRIKNPDTSLNTNYPFILRTQALSNWTHNIPKYMQDSASALGYSTQYTRILDSGGTVFTDGILGIKKFVLRSHHNVANHFKKLESTENFTLYENTCAVDLGLYADDQLLDDITGAKPAERFEVQNKLYAMFTGSAEPLFSVCSNKGETAERLELTYSDPKELRFTYTAGKNEILYLNVADFAKKSVKIFANGERIYAPYYKQTNYGYYPSQAVNGILTIGNYREGETVEISIMNINDETYGNETVQLAYMSLDRMSELEAISAGTVTNAKAGRTSFSFDYDNEQAKGKLMFIPITYDEGWRCEINGEKAEVLKAMGAYIAVRLPEAGGSVKLSRTTPGLFPGLIASVAGILAFALLVLMQKRGWSFPKFIATAVYILFVAAFAASFVLIYLVSIVFFVIMIYEHYKSSMQSVITQNGSMLTPIN